MARRDDVNSLYYLPNKISYVLQKVFWINVAASVFTWFIKNEIFLEVLFVLQIILSITYVVANIIDDNFFWYRAEKTRRQASIENAFGIDFTEYKTKKYYNNNFPKNADKFSVNAFESILHSKTTAGLMLLSKGIKTAIACIVFLCACLVYKKYGVLLIISQTVFSSYFLEEFIKLLLFKLRLDKLYEDLYRQLITVGIKDEKQKALILAYAIEYEAIKAHYKVRLSEKIFFKHNSNTSIIWNEICEKIKIE
ncbi:hypothetical protein [Clostridium grantii]|uniref:Uncharacterized protein n=1 Tax=Clostridium grantii DSM 8605 TaxID=1121316 RepID=A0A1M5RD07_9CLOT|nr:hypothetical protein [Clostridium grantii]SHH24161.1 hypothetical protein SAMN02745207_00463 [Clostridium grantii DSM 8605]